MQFFDINVAKRAIELVVPTFTMMVADNVVDRPHLAIRMAVRQGQAYETLAYHDIGDRADWAHAYDGIADSKIAITARTGLPSRVVQELYPELLENTDIMYWGSWIEPSSNIIAGCSGVDPWFDEAIAKMLVAAAKALVYERRLVLSTVRDNGGADYYDGMIAQAVS